MKRLLSISAALVLFALGLAAQTTSLTGTVSDPSGAVIPSATITIVNAETGLQRTAVADSQGRYTFSLVPPGTYKLTAKAPGFADVVIDKVELLVSQPGTVPIQFQKLGATTTTVEVEAAAAQVNTTDA